MNYCVNHYRSNAFYHGIVKLQWRPQALWFETQGTPDMTPGQKFLGMNQWDTGNKAEVYPESNCRQRMHLYNG